jgi:hypothetical protein
MGGTPSQQQRNLQRRRNPYDYLPDEPHMTSMTSSTAGVTSVAAAAAGATTVPGATNKPDIMQSVDGRLDPAAEANRAMMNRSVRALRLFFTCT